MTNKDLLENLRAAIVIAIHHAELARLNGAVSVQFAATNILRQLQEMERDCESEQILMDLE